jgi:hypothetical protein
MQLIEATWITSVPQSARSTIIRLAIVDRVDIANMASERPSLVRYGPAQDRRSDCALVDRRALTGGLYIDGGCTIRERSEHFTVRVDPTAELGRDSHGRSEELRLARGDRLPIEPRSTPARRSWACSHRSGWRVLRASFNLPGTPPRPNAGAATEATGLYRVFHWFILQPD